MEIPVVLGISVTVLLVLLRHFAARRIAARQGQFVWLMFVPTLLGGAVFLWASIWVYSNDPVVGALMVVASVVYLAVFVGFLRRLSRAVSSTGPHDDLATATTEPVVDYVSTMVGLGLIGGLIAMVGLIVWGVIQTAR